MCKPSRVFSKSGALVCVLLIYMIAVAVSGQAKPVRIARHQSPAAGTPPVLSQLIRAALPAADGLDQDTTEIEGGEVTGTWTADGSPYLVKGTITVPDYQSLTIEPGVEVIFDGHYQFIVEGKITAVGTESDLIVFTAVDSVVGWGGLRLVYADPQSRIEYCYFTLGSAEGDWPDNCGGALYMKGMITSVKYCQFVNNRAEKWGGAVYLWGGSPEFSHNLFTDNNARDDLHYGHAVYLGNANELTLNHVTITENEPGEGSALYVAMGTTLKMTNSILWDSYEFSYESGDITYNDIYDVIADSLNDMGMGNLSQDPRFNDPEARDFTLRLNSPCIDAAAPNAPFGDEPQPNGGRANMGVYGNTSFAALSKPLFSFDDYDQVTERDPVDFGLQKVGISDTLSITIYNVGRQVLEIDSVTFDNAAFTSNYALLADTATNTVLIQPDSSLSFGIVFNPDVVDSFSATASFYDNDESSQVTVSLLGVGVNPEIEVTPTSFEFSNLAVGETDTMTLVVKNTGENVGGIESLLLPTRFYGTDNFSIEDSTGSVYPRDTIRVGESVTYYAIFHPSMQGDFIETVTISSNAGDVDVVMSGSGSQPVAHWEPDTLAYGVIALGDSSTLELKVSNTGSVTLNLDPIELGDAVNFSYLVDQTALDQGDTATIAVIFHPSTAGTYNTTITVNTDDPDHESFSVRLLGTGTSQSNWWIGEVGDVTWEKDLSPYFIVGDVWIPEGQTLTVEPGVEVKFEGNFSVDVYGTLDAQGTQEDSIVFTTIDEVDSTWSGITFKEGSSASVLSYTKLRRGGLVDSSVYGGVMRVEGAAPTIEHCEFYDNQGFRGGALALLEWSQAEVRDCYFHDNAAQESGGAVFADWFSQSKIISCQVENNTAVSGGGLFFSGANGEISGSEIYGNQATETGGGLFLGDGCGTIVYDNVIYDNSAPNGGGIAVRWYSKPFLHDLVIHDNTATTAGGGIYIQDGATPLIVRTLVADNTAPRGQAVYTTSSGAIFDYSTLVGTPDADDGWILTAVNGDQTMVSHSIIGALDWTDPIYSPVAAEATDLMVTFSDVLDSAGAVYEGNGNENTDPGFAGGGSVSEIYQLSEDSPYYDDPIGFTGGTSDIEWAVTFVLMANPVQDNSLQFAFTSTLPLLTAPFLAVEQILPDSQDYALVDSSYMEQIAPMVFMHPLYQDEPGSPSRAILSYTNIFGQTSVDTVEFVASELSVQGSGVSLPGKVSASARAASAAGMWGLMSAPAAEPLSAADGLTGLGEAYEVFVTGTQLSSGRLEFTLSDEILGGLDAARCGIALQDEDGWRLLGAYLSADRKTIWTNLEGEGTYRLVWGEEITGTVILPSEIALSQNYPNPFNPETTIQFALPQAGKVTLEIYNLMGRRVVTLYDGYAAAGYHTVHWNGLNTLGRPASSGVYFYRLEADGKVISKKMVLLR